MRGFFWNVEKNQNNKFKRKTKHDLEVEPWGQYVELKIWPCCTNSDWTPYVGCLSLKAKLEQIDTRQSPSLIQGSHDYGATCQIMTLVMFTTLTSTCSKAVTFWQSALVSGNQLVSEQDSNEFFNTGINWIVIDQCSLNVYINLINIKALSYIFWYSWSHLCLYPLLHIYQCENKITVFILMKNIYICKYNNILIDNNFYTLVSSCMGRLNIDISKNKTAK